MIEKDSGTKKLSRIICADEDKELQRLLERNLNLLPGDQISPGQDLRWLLVKREMPVVNPSTGENLWSIDFLLVDQDGIPTLIECKRRNDTRSRREIVGQVLEYAASGRYYWTASDFRIQAQNTAGDEAKLRQMLNDLTGSDTVPEEFFAVMEKNLQRSKMRLIFFLDDSPFELRSIVEFLNGQLKDMEVLIIEARQYQYGDARIVVPWVFGFTEEARVAKRESKLETERLSPAKGEDAFWEALRTSGISPEWEGRVHEFVNQIREAPGCDLRWLRTCIVDLPNVVPQRTLLSIIRDGTLQLGLACWKPRDGSTLSARQSAAQNELFDWLRTTFDFSQEDLQSKQYPMVPLERWIPAAVQLAELIKRLGA
ncbi:MAG TPA: hypothetical protein VH640_30085 [Bryobacteraceae bacterium]